MRCVCIMNFKSLHAITIRICVLDLGFYSNLSLGNVVDPGDAPSSGYGMHGALISTQRGFRRICNPMPELPWIHNF